MQIQGTGEIGSTKRKFHLSGVPLIEGRLYSLLKSEINVCQILLSFLDH